DVVGSPSRTECGTVRTGCSARGEAASTRSTTTPRTSTSVHASTVDVRGTSSAGTTPTAATRTARRVRAMVSAGDGDGAQHAVEDRLGGDTLELGLGPQLHPVPQRGVGQRLDVVGRDVVPAAEPGPRPRGGEQRRRAPRGDPERERRRGPGGPADVDDVA